MLKKLTKAIFGNTRLKLLALGIALAIWFYGSSQLQEEALIVVPLTVQVPEGHQVVYQSALRIQLNLKGSHALIVRVRDQAAQNNLPMTVVLEGEGLREGVSGLDVDPGWLGMPKRDMVQLRVAGIEPDRVRIGVSKVIERKLPVEVAISGKPRPGYEVSGAAATPSEVTVRGPALLLDTMEAVRTLDVSVLDEQADLRRDVALQTVGSFQLADGTKVETPFEVEPARVVGHVNVVGNVVEKKLAGVRVHVLKPLDFPFAVEIPKEDSTVAVVLAGVKEDLEAITEQSVRAYVDLAGLAAESDVKATGSPYKRSVRLMLPPEARVTESRVEPKEITVILKKLQ